MKFTARTTWACFAHHPEVVFLSSCDDVNLRIQTFLIEDFCPDYSGFHVFLGGIIWAGFVDGCVEAFFGKFPMIHHQVPGPLNGFLFEIISKGPIPQHLEEGVVIGIQAYIFQVIVFPACSNTFLGICNSRMSWRTFPKEAGDKLVHPRIGKEQIGRGWKERGRRDNLVISLSKEVLK